MSQATPYNKRRAPTNRNIRAETVLLIDEEGGNIGEIPFEDALSRAQTAGLDLVAVNPTINPPVCKILDYNKMKYQKSKKQKPAKAGRKKMREIKLRAVTDEGDYKIKMKKVEAFILDGEKVQVSIRFRGREIFNQKDLAFAMLQRVKDDLSSVAQTDREAKLEGRQITMHLISLKQKTST